MNLFLRIITIFKKYVMFSGQHLILLNQKGHLQKYITLLDFSLQYYFGQLFCSVWHIIEMFYLNSTLNCGIPPVLVFQLEVYYKVDRLLTGLSAQQKGTTARWYSNKTSWLCMGLGQKLILAPMLPTKFGS